MFDLKTYAHLCSNADVITFLPFICQIVSVLIPFLIFVGLDANNNLQIHERICDVTAGSDGTSWLICAFSLSFQFSLLNVVLLTEGVGYQSVNLLRYKPLFSWTTHWVLILCTFSAAVTLCSCCVLKLRPHLSRKSMIFFPKFKQDNLSALYLKIIDFSFCLTCPEALIFAIICIYIFHRSFRRNKVSGFWSTDRAPAFLNYYYFFIAMKKQQQLQPKLLDRLEFLLDLCGLSNFKPPSFVCWKFGLVPITVYIHVSRISLVGKKRLPTI